MEAFGTSWPLKSIADLSSCQIHLSGIHGDGEASDTWGL